MTYQWFSYVTTMNAAGIASRLTSNLVYSYLSHYCTVPPGFQSPIGIPLRYNTFRRCILLSSRRIPYVDI